MKRSLALTFFVSALLSGIVAFARTSNAWTRLVPGVACGGSGFDTSDPLGLANRSTKTLITVCPYVEDGNNLKSSVSQIFVDYLDSDTAHVVWAAVCSKTWNDGGYTCGPSRTNGPASFTGTNSINLSDADVTTAWGDGFFDDYGFVQVQIPATSGAVPSVLYGLTMN